VFPFGYNALTLILSRKGEEITHPDTKVPPPETRTDSGSSPEQGSGQVLLVEGSKSLVPPRRDTPFIKGRLFYILLFSPLVQGRGAAIGANPDEIGRALMSETKAAPE